MQQANDKYPKKEINGRPVLEKKTFHITFFTSVLCIAREMEKTKGKNPDKMCRLKSF